MLFSVAHDCRIVKLQEFRRKVAEMTEYVRQTGICSSDGEHHIELKMETKIGLNGDD